MSTENRLVFQTRSCISSIDFGGAILPMIVMQPAGPKIALALPVNQFLKLSRTSRSTSSVNGLMIFHLTAMPCRKTSRA